MNGRCYLALAVGSVSTETGQLGGAQVKPSAAALCRRRLMQAWPCCAVMVIATKGAKPQIPPLPSRETNAAGNPTVTSAGSRTTEFGVKIPLAHATKGPFTTSIQPGSSVTQGQSQGRVPWPVIFA